MPRPGISVTTRDAPAASGPPIRTGTAFIAGTTERGLTNVAQKVESIADFARIYGDRMASSYMYDAVDAFFREGGGSAYITRVVGPAATPATVDLEDSTDPTITVEAAGQGDSGNDLTITITVATGVTTLIVEENGIEVERYATSDGKDGLLGYDGFKYIVLSDAHAGGGDPIAVADAALTGGTDDLGSISADDYSDALAFFVGGYGPGQVLAPGITDTDVHEALLVHAESHNRVALLDAPNTNVLATLEASATAATDTGLGSYGAMFTPWVKVPSSASGSSRTVPYSAVQAGLEARRDRIASQNIPAAGRSFPLSYVQSFVYDFTDDDRTELIEYGVNTAHNVGGVRETYGYRSLADANSESNWVQFNYSRLRMAISARAQDIGESFLFAQIDGRGLKLSEFGAAIGGMLLDFFVLGSLYGDSPQEAFNVDVGPAVNTAETIAAGELHAVAAVRMSPHAEMVIIEIVKTPITQSVGG